MSEARDGSVLRGRAGMFVGFGLSTFLAFPHEIPFAGSIGLPSSIDLGLVTTWLIPAFLALAIDGETPRRAARLAFLASFVTHTAFFYWFTVVTVVYGGMPFLLGILAPLLPALYVAPFTALFAYGWARFGGRAPLALLLGGAGWVVIDWLRGVFMGGFPWGTLGYGLHLDLPMLAYTRLGGVYVLSFVAAVAGLALASAWRHRDRAGARTLAWIVAAVLLLHLSSALYDPLATRTTRTIRVAAIQGNIDQGEKWDAGRRERILAAYLRLSDTAANEGVDWIVWPETAVPGLIENDGGLRRQLALLAQRHGASLVVGGMGVEVDREARRFSAFFDSAFHFDPDGELRDRYDKTHLVPFGEFVPLRGLLGNVFKSLATGLSSTDVTAGARPRNMLIRPEVGSDERLLAGVPICYELLFPDLVRRFAGEGAGALLAITNDAWYGRTGAPHQFLAMTTMRAAENGLPLVRAANTGISALVDARGRVTKRSELFREDQVVGEIEIPVDVEPTLYARVGDLFVGLCFVACVIGAGAKVSRERRSRPSRA